MVGTNLIPGCIIKDKSGRGVFRTCIFAQKRYRKICTRGGCQCLGEAALAAADPCKLVAVRLRLDGRVVPVAPAG